MSATTRNRANIVIILLLPFTIAAESIRRKASDATTASAGKIIVTLFMTGILLSCGKEPTAAHVYGSLLGSPLASAAKIDDWKIVRGIGELRAFFSINMPKEWFESSFPPQIFVRNVNEEGAEMLAIYSRDISKQMGRLVKLPSPAVHLTGKFPGKSIHVFWQEASGSLLVWVTPGPVL